MKILVLSGPNLNMINKRNHQFYGNYDLESIETYISDRFSQITFEFFQTNDENILINRVHSAPDHFNGLIINPGGFSHSSIALRDALEICSIPKIEVHLSNIASRESFRRYSLTASVCDGYISGFKHISYLSAVYSIIEIIIERSKITFRK